MIGRLFNSRITYKLWSIRIRRRFFYRYSSFKLVRIAYY